MDVASLIANIEETILEKESLLRMLPSEINALRIARDTLRKIGGANVSPTAQPLSPQVDTSTQSNGHNNSDVSTSYQEPLLPQTESRKKNSLPKGFSLTESIKGLLLHIEGDITQPLIYDLLTAKYPDVAPYIQRASIATTLGKLEDRGVLKVTDPGYGSQPRVYRKVVQEAEM
jgi:hypothetical protein